LELDKGNLEIRFAKLYGQLLDSPSSKKSRDYLWATYDQREKAHEIIRSLLKMKRDSKETEVGDSLVYASSFVLAFEGSYVRTIDSIIFLLVLTGHDIFDPLRDEYAHSPEGIGKIALKYKFKFLIEHKFDTVVREEDSELRNKIAHQDFEICGQYKIRIKGKEYDLKARLVALLSFVRDITKPFVAALQKESERRGITPSNG
jgi:hypothetical protein